MNYFQKTFRPSVVNGDVSGVIQANATDLPFSVGDVLFDWTAVDVPLGTNAIVDGLIHVYGEDGGVTPNADIVLLIATDNDGAAPTSLGTVNVAPNGCYELPDILTGSMKFEGTGNLAGRINIGNSGAVFMYNYAAAGGQNGHVVIQPNNNGLSGNATTNRIYIAGIAGGALDFSTGVLKNAAETSNTEVSLTTKTVDPRKAFRVGDTVYIHDVDTAIGTIASMTATNITLNAAIAGGTDIADEDEFINDKPLTITLGFKGK